MIQEAYVSFEVAKLLKEKGFLIVTPDWYYVNGEWEHHNSVDFQNNNIDNIIPACTQQMAMRWLRDVHNIHIIALLLEKEDGDYGYTIEDINDRKYLGTSKNNSYKTYEEVCEAAIKHCLEKLI